MKIWLPWELLYLYNSKVYRSLNCLFFIRFGVAEAHGAGAALQLNTYLGDTAVLYLPTSKTYQVNFGKLVSSVRELVGRICAWQHAGDRQVVEQVFRRLGRLDETTLGSLARLEGIPTDIRPCYPLAGEQC